MSKKGVKIVFLNQMAGPLFRELAEDLAKVWTPSLLYTGHPHTANRPNSAELLIQAGPVYDRRSKLKRLISWLWYFCKAFRVAAGAPSGALLFLVSNPPFLGLIGLLFKKLRGQRYVVLVYDIYPDLLHGLGKLRPGLISRAWDYLNRFVLENSCLVFTIGEDMAALLNEKYDLAKTRAGGAVVIPNWADIEAVRPLAKEDNWFAVQHGQVGKTTVLYSGNMGNTHDIESILEVAWELRGAEEIHFLFIGEGEKWSLVERVMREKNLENITLLPFQPEEVLPYSMAAGDIGIVAYQPGTENCIVPSKTYYYMAAGLVPLVISERETDLGKMVSDRRCGMAVGSRNIEAMKQAILALGHDQEMLRQYRVAARQVAEDEFSRNNTALFTKALRRHGCLAE